LLFSRSFVVIGLWLFLRWRFFLGLLFSRGLLSRCLLFGFFGDLFFGLILIGLLRLCLLGGSFNGFRLFRCSLFSLGLLECSFLSFGLLGGDLISLGLLRCDLISLGIFFGRGLLLLLLNSFFFGLLIGFLLIGFFNSSLFDLGGGVFLSGLLWLCFFMSLFFFLRRCLGWLLLLGRFLSGFFGLGLIFFLRGVWGRGFGLYFLLSRRSFNLLRLLLTGGLFNCLGNVFFWLLLLSSGLLDLRGLLNRFLDS